MLSPVLEKLEKIEALEARATGLRADLRHSIMLQDIWPDVFKFGKATTQATGNPHDIITWNITDGAGNIHKMDLIDVPIELWGADIIESIDNVHHFDSKYSRPLRIHRRREHLEAKL